MSHNHIVFRISANDNSSQKTAIHVSKLSILNPQALMLPPFKMECKKIGVCCTDRGYPRFAPRDFLKDATIRVGSAAIPLNDVSGIPYTFGEAYGDGNISFELIGKSKVPRDLEIIVIILLELKSYEPRISKTVPSNFKIVSASIPIRWSSEENKPWSFSTGPASLNLENLVSIGTPTFIKPIQFSMSPQAETFINSISGEEFPTVFFALGAGVAFEKNLGAEDPRARFPLAPTVLEKTFAYSKSVKLCEVSSTYGLCFTIKLIISPCLQRVLETPHPNQKNRLDHVSLTFCLTN
jgi:hypothetical protein